MTCFFHFFGYCDVPNCEGLSLFTAFFRITAFSSDSEGAHGKQSVLRQCVHNGFGKRQWSIALLCARSLRLASGDIVMLLCCGSSFSGLQFMKSYEAVTVCISSSSFRHFDVICLLFSHAWGATPRILHSSFFPINSTQSLGSIFSLSPFRSFLVSFLLPLLSVSLLSIVSPIQLLK